ncbi:hypothetical protein E3N88_36628 [Mikania micrantha]|uniref:Uncharacterized protein n=1 Tax=Mikania micrantha TaxID=192012 RepID=A0A5N6M4U1_9ASTR|nr:hypothetical protein E3N88_36628 [Mikania micrantha]
MRKLISNDEAFHLSRRKIRVITDIIRSRKTPARSIFLRWNVYARSFYLKMCTCYGFDHQHLENEDEDDDDEDENQLLCDRIEPFQLPLDKTELRMEYVYKEETPLQKMERERLESVECVSVMPIRSGPLESGCYSPGTEPDRIPYHLYLLVKEAVDFMKHNDQINLEGVEEKIRFFCTYLHSHLPTGWEYKRNNGSSLIADYDTMRVPKYDMSGYTPFRDLDEMEVDEDINLTSEEMGDVMSIIHSRKTPQFMKLSWPEISFYCKLCSCFGIEYHNLEAASEDDVCLMNMGRG